MEKTENLIKSVLGKEGATSALAFIITLDIIREVEIYSLASRVVRTIFSSFEDIKGVQLIRDKDEIASYGETTPPFMNFPLTSGYVLKVFVQGRLKSENLNLLRYVQSILSYHIQNILKFERIKEKATIDSLTGAYTRTFGEEFLKKYFQSATRGRSFSLVFVDIDNLKLINDSQGHEKGDKLLKEFVHTFKNNVRGTDIIIRWGGDEFLILLDGASKNDAIEIMERIASYFDGDFSYGVVSVPEEVKDLNTAVKIADSRMYEMKKQKSNYVFDVF
ncbi:MAG: GGDEF domain-containing protein [Thermotogaceae bacterium]|nr:GGDEF domain-containing protein [Thermotogaceae bacterium]